MVDKVSPLHVPLLARKCDGCLLVSLATTNANNVLMTFVLQLSIVVTISLEPIRLVGRISNQGWDRLHSAHVRKDKTGRSSPKPESTDIPLAT